MAWLVVTQGGFSNIGLRWEFAIALAVAAGVLTWRFNKMALHDGEMV